MASKIWVGASGDDRIRFSTKPQHEWTARDDSVRLHPNGTVCAPFLLLGGSFVPPVSPSLLAFFLRPEPLHRHSSDFSS